MSYTRIVSGAVLWGAAVSSIAASEAPLIRYRYAPGDITRLCTEALAKGERGLAEIAALPAAQRNADSVLVKFDTVLTDLSDETGALTFMKDVNTDEALRKEGTDCEEKVGPFWVDVFTRKPLYQAMLAVKARNAGETRLQSELIESFEENGLKLSDSKLNRVKSLKQQLSVLETKFSTNINEDKSSLELTADELAGVPDSVLARFERKPDGHYVVSNKSTDYVPVMENCRVADTRRRAMSMYYNRAADKNVSLLNEVLKLRREVASIMGYATWADYRTSHGRMAKSGTEVLTFLNGLREKLAQRSKDDLAKLLEFKRSQEPGADRIDAWDSTYYGYQLKKRDYTLDDELIREYLPADVVVKGMFDIYSKLLGVRYELVANADTWAPNVKLYRIVDVKSGALLAHFYADFFPRQGKYTHAAAFPLVSGRATANGGYAKPVSAIVANFTPPSGDKPSLLSHDEVETVFHEFGHIMHQTLTKVAYGSLSGTAVARDFVEAPSQMLENWVWSPQLLAKLSKHYRTGKKIPADLVQRMIAARDFNQGLFYTRQLYLGLLDMTYHTATSAIDTTAVQDRLQREIVGIEPIPGGHFQASFGHLMGYDAGYYGYLWSEVFAADMFTRFEAGGLLSPQVGGAYRSWILERGNLVEAKELLKGFLGREPNSQAFFRKLHISE